MRTKALWTIFLILLVTGTAQAGSVTLELRRKGLANVDDAAGRWQHEGGEVFKATTHVGHYVIVRRVTTAGTTAQNTAAVTMTIFFFKEKPPQNITLQGAHDFSSGVSRGSVSGASNRYDWVRDATFSAEPTRVRIDWLGSEGLTLP